MHDTLDVRPGLVDGGVQEEAGLVDPEVGGSLLHQISLHVDLHQRGSCHLVVKHAEWV